MADDTKVHDATHLFDQGKEQRLESAMRAVDQLLEIIEGRDIDGVALTVVTKQGEIHTYCSADANLPSMLGAIVFLQQRVLDTCEVYEIDV